jgi:hypothetical protein
VRARPRLLILLLACACAAAGCGATRTSDAVLALDLARTRQAGTGPAYRPPPIGNRAVASGQPVGPFLCNRTEGHLYGAHIELFAWNRGIVVPAGIGIAPPRRRRGPYVIGGRCSYPLRTTDPTGIIEIDGERLASPPTVGQLFVLWGEPLSPSRLGAFRAGRGPGVVAFVNGRRRRGNPAAIPLHRHVQIVLEVGPLVAPHPTYLFPPGL